MNPKLKDLAEKVIEFFKNSEKSKLIPGINLMHLLPDNNLAEKVIYSLEKDFGLIERCGRLAFRLTDKGWKFTTFDKYDKEIKKTPLNSYQKIYLPFFILFGLFGIYKIIQPTVPINDFEKLENNFNSLNSKFDSILKHTEKVKMESPDDRIRAE